MAAASSPGCCRARLALPYMRLERFGLLLVIGAVLVLPRVADGFDPVGWALRTVVRGRLRPGAAAVLPRRRARAR